MLTVQGLMAGAATCGLTEWYELSIWPDVPDAEPLVFTRLKETTRRAHDVIATATPMHQATIPAPSATPLT